MSVAGVRLSDGRALWIEAGDREIVPRQTVLVTTADGEQRGYVCVTPDQLVGAAPRVDGTLLRVLRETTWRSDEQLPGADLPPLGAHHDDGIITAIDAVNGTFTVRSPEGEERGYRVGR